MRKEKIENDLFGKDEVVSMMQIFKSKTSGNKDDEDMDSGEKNVAEFKDLHENWLIDFLNKGGFSALINILKTFVSEQKSRQAEDTLTSTAESQCL